MEGVYTAQHINGWLARSLISEKSGSPSIQTRFFAIFIGRKTMIKIYVDNDNKPKIEVLNTLGKEVRYSLIPELIL